MLDCDSYALRILEEGYKVAFKSTPPSHYFERNNLSARRSPNFVESEIQNLLDKNLIVECFSRPSFCNPLTVVHGKKDRLVLDLSRCVNKHVKSPHFKIDDLQKAMEITVQGDYQVVSDLHAAYHHIRIHPEHYKYL